VGCWGLLEVHRSVLVISWHHQCCSPALTPPLLCPCPVLSCCRVLTNRSHAPLMEAGVDLVDIMKVRH